MSLVSRKADPDLELLREYAVGGDYGRGPKAGELLEVTVTGCAYSCCGRGWQQRRGYEQTYRGYIDNLHGPTPKGTQASFMLYSAGIGTLNYVCAIVLSDVALIEPAGVN